MNDEAPRLPGLRIRKDIEANILSGTWPPGFRVPSEHALMQQYACSRMTVNKVLSNLAAAGLIVRRRHVGTFVTAPGSERAMMEIQDLAEEARRLGQSYRYEILARAVRPATRDREAAPGLRAGGAVLDVACRHFIDERPYAYEERIISLAQVPAVRDACFAEEPPGTWLLRHVPWSEAEHVIRARSADDHLAQILQIAPGAACLVLNRRTWHGGKLITDVTLTYPGERHSFVGRFSPAGAT